jgi:hypothetical protein
MKMGKRKKKEKEKDFSVKRVGGNFGPAEHVRAAARAASPARHANRAQHGDDAVGAGPHASKGKGGHRHGGKTMVCPQGRRDLPPAA